MIKQLNEKKYEIFLKAKERLNIPFIYQAFTPNPTNSTTAIKNNRILDTNKPVEIITVIAIKPGGV
jgi:predicted HAD superfamily phosphohydrolase YqeG